MGKGKKAVSITEAITTVPESPKAVVKNETPKEVVKPQFTPVVKKANPVVQQKETIMAATDENINRQIIAQNDWNVKTSPQPIKESFGAATATTKKAQKAFKKETRKTIMKELKTTLKEHRKAKKDGTDSSGVGIVVLVILAFIIPPLAVFLSRGIGTAFWINLILTLLFWLPGVIHALVVIFEDN